MYMTRFSVLCSETDQKPALQSRLATWDDDEDAVLPMIPDLEDVQEEDLALQVAAAPRSGPVRLLLPPCQDGSGCYCPQVSTGQVVTAPGQDGSDGCRP